MREWALEGQIETKAAEVRNLFELVRTKATAMGKVGYVVGTNNVQVGLDNKALGNSIDSSPRVIMAYVDVNQNSTFDSNNDEIVALVDMGNVESHLSGTFAVLPSGISGQLDQNGPQWFTQLTDTDNYEFQVCLSTGGKDFFNYAFVIDSTGRIQETRSRGKNLCPEQSDNASSK